jgi:hypothetical protein
VGSTDRNVPTVPQSAHTAVILRCSPPLRGEPRRMEASAGVCGRPSRRRARARLLRMTRVLDGGMAQGCGAKLVRRSSVQSFATHLIAPGFKTPAIAKAHFLMRRTTPIGLVRLAQKASRTRGFRTFALVVHGFSACYLRHFVRLRECPANGFGFVLYDINERARCAGRTTCP